MQLTSNSRPPRIVRAGRSPSAELVSQTWLICAVILATGAWIYPFDSATDLEVTVPFYSLFKALCYAVFCIQGALGLIICYKNDKYRLISSLFLLQALVIIASMLLAGEYFYSGQAIVGFMGISFSAVAAYHSLGARRSLDLLAYTVTAILLASIALALVFPSVGQHGTIFAGQWRGLFAHKNQLGQIAFVGVGLLWPFLAQRKYSKVALLALPAVTCLAMAGSGTSLATALLGLGLVGSYRAGRRMGISSSQMGALLALVSIAGFLLQSIILEFTISSLGKDLTLTGRTDIWSYLWTVALEAPILGHGPYYLIIDQTMMDWVRTNVEFMALRSAHNAYLETILEFGFVGFLLLLAPYLYIISRWICGKFRSEMFGYLVPSLMVPLLFYNISESASHMFLGIGTLLVNLVMVAASERAPQPGSHRATNGLRQHICKRAVKA